MDRLTESNEKRVLTSSIEIEHFKETLLSESIAMAEYTLSSGKVPDPLLLEKLNYIASKSQIDNSNIGSLASVHKSLSLLISPATPNGICLLQTEKASMRFWNFLGPVPLVRKLMLLTLIFLVLMITVGLSREVSFEMINKGIFDDDGGSLLLNLTFLLCCAGLGACFQALYQVNQYISNANYDPKYDSTYWVRVLLGIIAGFFLVELLPPDLFTSKPMSSENGDAALEAVQSRAKPVMALLGGFSASMVYRVLNRLVDSVESVVKGDQRSLNAARAELQQAQLEHHKLNLQTNVAGDLKILEEKIKSGNPEQSIEHIRKMLGEIIPSSIPVGSRTASKTDEIKV